VIGGLGAAVAEVTAARAPARVLRVGVQDVFGETGPPDKLLEKYGLTAGAICAAARQVTGA
jgi:transketolase